MRPDTRAPLVHGVVSIDVGSGGGVFGKILKWGRRAFPERQFLLRSEGRVRHLTLSRRVQVTMAATVGVAAIALLGYGATNALILDRDGADKRAEADQVGPANAALQARVDELQRELAVVKAASMAAKPVDGGETVSHASPEQLEAHIKALEAARDQATAEKKELQRQLGAAQQAIDAKAQNLAQLNRTLDANRGELRQSDQQRQALQSRVQQLESDLDAAKRKLQQAAADRDKTVAEREQLAARLSDLQALGTPSVAAPPNAASSGKAPSMDSVPALAPAPRALADRPPPDQRSQNTGELEQLIASTGIDVEDLLARLSVPAGQGGPYVALDTTASPEPPPTARRAEELQKIVMTLPLAAPLTEYRLESGFGGRPDPFTRRQAFHPGLDMVAPYRTPVYSTAPGVVKFAGVKSAYGKVVEIDHGHGIVTRFGHLHRITVARGQQITAHQQVGELGSTGRSTGPHLHYEVLVNGTPTDPEKFLQAGKNVVQASSR